MTTARPAQRGAQHRAAAPSSPRPVTSLHAQARRPRAAAGATPRRPAPSALATDPVPAGAPGSGGSAAAAGGGAATPGGAALLGPIVPMRVPTLFGGARRRTHSPGSLALVLRLERPG